MGLYWSGASSRRRTSTQLANYRHSTCVMTLRKIAKLIFHQSQRCHTFQTVQTVSPNCLNVNQQRRPTTHIVRMTMDTAGEGPAVSFSKRVTRLRFLRGLCRSPAFWEDHFFFRRVILPKEGRARRQRKKKRRRREREGREKTTHTCPALTRFPI